MTGSRFEVTLSEGLKLKGAVLAHQFRTVDWLVRRAELHSRASDDLVHEVLARIDAILSIELH